MPSGTRPAGSAEDTAFAVRGVLDGHQHRTAPFAAGRDALQDAQGDQQDRCRDADGGIGGQKPDQGGCHAHQGQGHHQDHAPTVAVTVVSGQECTERAEQEADADREERQDGRDPGACGLEEQFAEDQARGHRVDEEVVPLDGGADDGGENHSATILFGHHHGR